MEKCRWWLGILSVLALASVCRVKNSNERVRLKTSALNAAFNKCSYYSHNTEVNMFNNFICEHTLLKINKKCVKSNI